MIVAITMSIGIGITIALAIKSFLDYGFELIELIGIGVCGILCSIMISLVMFLFVYTSALCANTKDVIVCEKPIQAIADSTGVKGNLFAINTNDSIKVIVNENGCKTIEKYDINACKIYEDNQTKVVYINEVTDSKRVDFWLGSNVKLGERYEIHIPKGSITTDFKIDLE